MNPEADDKRDPARPAHPSLLDESHDPAPEDGDWTEDEAIELSVPVELAGERLDSALASLLPEYSRERIKRWIRDHRVLVDDASARPSDRLAGGEHVSLRVQAEPDVWHAAEPIALDIVAEDPAFYVIAKPAGMVVHPGAGNPSHTLLNALLSLQDSLQSVPRAGLVHRLDKDTSGLLLVARTLRSHTALVRALADREIHRGYLAVVHGRPPAEGTVDAPIGRHPSQRTQMAVVASGRPARTHYRREAQYTRHALMGLELETGRTHQIRVHMAHLGHPIVGDPVYRQAGRGGGPGANREQGRATRLAQRHRQSTAAAPVAADTERLQAALGQLQRQALHARVLSFRHPLDGHRLRFEARPPGDLQALLDALAEGERLD